MALATAEPVPFPRDSNPRRKPKGKPLRDQHHLLALLSDAQATYTTSQFAKTIEKHLTVLAKNSPTPITRILSLGLGSLCSPEKGQTRRVKQLVLLLAIRDSLHTLLASPIEVYAQDPAFTRQDEAFLSTLNIRISRTSSGSSLGEAAALLTLSTLVYSPFLTLEAYEQVFVHSPLLPQYFIGDDFNALLEKWPKYSAERAQVQTLMKGALGRYRRKAVTGAGFWEERDGAFPMAVYAVQKEAREKAKI